MKSILVAGAYSPGNIGDGLLAELSVQMANDALPCTIYLSALDAKGFRQAVKDFPEKYPGLFPGNVFSSLNIFRIIKLMLNKDLVVLAIGGEYLNFIGFKAALKSFIANGIAIFFSLCVNKPTGFLPQGIILSKKMCKYISPFLRKAKWILLRDSKSMEELSSLDNIYQVSDLAIIDVHPILRLHPASPVIGSILHEVSKSPEFISRIKQISNTHNMKFFVQSNFGGHNKDTDFLEKKLKINGFEGAGKLYDSETNVGVVISTRLHGAVGAIRSGIPAIHIAYSRKGKAVFSDLGIPEFCFDFENFDPVALLKIAHELNSSTEFREVYWTRISMTSPFRHLQKRNILKLIQNLAGGPE